MKKTLSYDANGKQYRTDIGQPPRRFYLGADETAAKKRKQQLVTFWSRTKSEGWTTENVDIAKAIAKGGPVFIRQSSGSDEEFARTEKRIVAKVAGVGVEITGTLQAADWHSASMAMM